jgi:3,4-dihydroxy 2-butanone 4-phosphate synthase/GTP cyclohydrolase II
LVGAYIGFVCIVYFVCFEYALAMTGPRLLRNAAAPNARDSSMAQLSSRELSRFRDWTGAVSVQVDDPRAEPAPLPEPAFRLLLEVLSQMARGNVVAVTPIEAELTTQQAAELLGVSRPHFVKLLETRQLPHRKVGAHRRVAFADLAAYRAGADTRQKAEQFMKLNSIDEAVRAIADGEMVIVVDDDDRENEGDLVMAASKATAQQVAFMIRHTSGILCAPIMPDRARALQLEPMVRDNNAPLRTAFTVSVDYREGLTTGISAEERANTVRALANGNVIGEDFVRPGHVFPLIAKDGGVLMRSGHTEAAVDLARLAELPPVGLLAELVNDDGSVKRLTELVGFAQEHKLKIVSIADLIAYRRTRERLVERVQEFEVQTEIGPARAIAYATAFDSVQHLALVFGQIARAKSPPVRIHRQEVISDVFGQRRPGETNLISAALERIKTSGAGVVVYLREGATGVLAPSLHDQAAERGETPTGSENKREQHWREVGVGAQILKDLGLTAITLLTTHQLDYVGLAGFDIRITGSEIIGGG